MKTQVKKQRQFKVKITAKHVDMAKKELECNTEKKNISECCPVAQALRIKFGSGFNTMGFREARVNDALFWCEESYSFVQKSDTFGITKQTDTIKAMLPLMFTFISVEGSDQ